MGPDTMNLALFECEKISGQACLWLLERLKRNWPGRLVINVCLEKSTPILSPCPAADTGPRWRQFGLGIQNGFDTELLPDRP